MKIKFAIPFLLLQIIAISLLPAQNATLRGKVTNGETGENILGATVRLLQGEQIKGGAYTDLEGAYTIKTQPGTYDLIISYVSFVSDTITGVEAKAGEVVTNPTLLYENVQVREDLAVDIVAKRNNATTVTLFNVKRTSLNTVDGISTDLIKRTGDNDVGAAMQRVTGVTVEGGKYVYVRGLGDRYSTTLLNGAVIPGLDPNRNSVQLDIFPSQLIDNVVVYKTFTPDLPANFTGGLINVITKDFPDRFKLNFSASMSFNPQSNLRDDFLTYQTGSKDWQGKDDGTRAIPEYISNLPDGIPARTFNDAELAQTIDQASKAFETDMSPITGNSFLNQNYQISVGNQHQLFGRPFGYIASLSYRNSYSAYQGGEVARWKNTSADGNISSALNNQRTFIDNKSSEEVLWGGLIKLSYKPADRHKISLNYMHNQSGNSYARTLEGPIPDDAVDLIFQTRVLGYLERAIDVFQFQGDHAFGPLKAGWIVSKTYSSQSSPDLRFFSNDYTVQGETRQYDLQENLYPAPFRFFRDLTEDNLDARLDLVLPVNIWKEQQAKIKFGGAYTSKDRMFSEQRFQITKGNISEPYNGSPEAYFSDENSGVRVDIIQGFTQYNYRNFVEDVTEARNTYSGTQSITGAYGMIELPISERLNVVGGARFERTIAETISQDEDAVNGDLDLNDILPAISAKYKLTESMNLRGSVTRTLARPTFREFSPFVSFDFIGDYQLYGNPDLDRTLIDNYDLRWEWYPSPSELISVSGFYKNFQNPIEKVLVPEAAITELTYKNTPEAEAYGIEIEVRKTLGFISPFLSNFQVGGNLSIIESQVDINEEEYQEILSVDPTRPGRRPMYGQSPYAVNGELAYINDSLGTKISASYNIFGERIAVVGGADPDVYEQPRGLLNLSISQRIGTTGFSVRLRANNLLNPAYKQTQTYKEQEYIFQSYTVGRSYSLGFSYQF